MSIPAAFKITPSDAELAAALANIRVNDLHQAPLDVEMVSMNDLIGRASIVAPSSMSDHLECDESLSDDDESDDECESVESTRSRSNSLESDAIRVTPVERIDVSVFDATPIDTSEMTIISELIDVEEQQDIREVLDRMDVPHEPTQDESRVHSMELSLRLVEMQTRENAMIEALRASVRAAKRNLQELEHALEDAEKIRRRR